MGTLMLVKNGNRVIGRCDKKCYNAKHPECKCVCNGINHGVGIAHAYHNTMDMIREGFEYTGPNTKTLFPMHVRIQAQLFPEIKPKGRIDYV